MDDPNDADLDLFGLDDSSLAFVDDGPAPLDEEISQSYFDSADWDYQSTPSSESYIATTLAPAAEPLQETTAWPQPLFSQSNSEDATAADEHTSSNVDPAFIFGAAMPSGGETKPRYRYPAADTLTVPTLTPALQEELRNIAMPPSLRYKSPKSSSSPSSAADGTKTGSPSSPEAAAGSSKAGTKKRKLSDADDDDDENDDGKPVKKSAHNMIEKKYRMNLNDKIAALRDSVPSLRIMSKSVKGEDTTGDREELHGLTPAHKLNKATVLSKATEYIRHLEKRNGRLNEENSTMQARIAAFEKLFLAGAMNGSFNPVQQAPTPRPYSHDTHLTVDSAISPISAGQDRSASPVGMIQVPDDMRRILQAQMGAGVNQPYPVPQQTLHGPSPVLIQQQQIQQQTLAQQGRWSNAGPYFGKLMVGSLAGLMILEAAREEQGSNESPEGRGLFALPLQLLKPVAAGLDLHVMGYHVHTSLKLLLLLGTFLWIFAPSLFPAAEQHPKKSQVVALQPAPSLASSIHVRRQAWLTAIQTVWVPRHNLLLEAAAMAIKVIKLSLLNTVGVHGYHALTRATEEQETARAQAWTIAVDSQLAGGDVEISTSRLVLTLLASGTLPDTPTNLMLKALHIRILLWDLGRNRLRLGVSVAAKLASSRWNKARQLNKVLRSSGNESAMQHEDELPDHLAALVEQDCDIVLNDDVILRAHNLAFNKETTYGVENPIDGMDAVVEDTTMGSPMDAVAAWWSTQALHRILTATLEKNCDETDVLAEDIDAAIKTAPIGSIAQVRATVARAVLIEQSRGANIASALEVVGTGSASPYSKPMTIIESGSCSSDPDLRLSLRCAVAIGHLRRPETTAAARQQSLRLANLVLMPDAVASMSLLGFTAAFELMEHLFEHRDSAEAFQPILERLAANLRLWIGGPAGEQCGVGSRARHRAVDRCLGITKTLVGMEMDTGYGSMSEQEEVEQ